MANQDKESAEVKAFISSCVGDGVECLVVGCGIVGVHTALALAEKGFKTRILARRSWEETVSSVAGAIWFPFHVDPPEKVRVWAKDAYIWWMDAHKQYGFEGSGISLVDLYEMFDSHKTPPWVDHCPGVEIKKCPHGVNDIPGPSSLPTVIQDVWKISQIPLIEPDKTMPFLLKKFFSCGGSISLLNQAPLKDLCSLVGVGIGVVVNCTGLGSCRLGGVCDKNLFPSQGQVVSVASEPKYEARGIETWGSLPLTYTLSRSCDTILGGTNIVNQWDTTIDYPLAERIIDRCIILWPHLSPTYSPTTPHQANQQAKQAEQIEKQAHQTNPTQPLLPPPTHTLPRDVPTTITLPPPSFHKEMKEKHGVEVGLVKVGLRPCRKGGVRLEIDHGLSTTTPTTTLTTVLHCYGHGGAGWTLAPGCAKEVVELVLGAGYSPQPSAKL